MDRIDHVPARQRTVLGTRAASARGGIYASSRSRTALTRTGTLIALPVGGRAAFGSPSSPSTRTHLSSVNWRQRGVEQAACRAPAGDLNSPTARAEAQASEIDRNPRLSGRRSLRPALLVAHRGTPHARRERARASRPCEGKCARWTRRAASVRAASPRSGEIVTTQPRRADVPGAERREECVARLFGHRGGVQRRVDRLLQPPRRHASALLVQRQSVPRQRRLIFREGGGPDG